MKRRDFVTLISGAAIAWPLKGRAQQQSGQPRRIGILHDYPKNDPEGLLQISAFREELAKLGWIEGRNIVIDLQAGDVEAEVLRTYARELWQKGQTLSWERAAPLSRPYNVPVGQYRLCLSL